jgi:capsular exopolysaccharide synthesis family protein
MTEEKDIYREESVDVKYYLFKFLDYWYLFLIAVPVCLAIAYYVNHKNPKLYKVQTTLLIRQEQSAMDMKSMLPENLLGGTTIEDQTVHNEIGILKSYKLTQQTIHDLDFEVSYYREQSLADRQLYHNAPFYIVYDTNHVQPVHSKIRVKKLKDGSLNVSMDKEVAHLYNYNDQKIHQSVNHARFSKNIEYDEYIETRYCRFKLVPASESSIRKWNSDYYFKFSPYKSLYRRYHNFEVSTDDKSTILTISLKTQNVEKGKRFLNTLMEYYMKRSVKKKNEIATETIGFINKQIDEVSDSLSESEKELEQFRSSEKLLDVGILTEKSYENLDKLQSEKAEILVRLKYFDYLKEYLSKNKDIQELVAPSSMGIEDPMLQKLISRLTELYSEKTDLEINSRKENPYLSRIKVKINELKSTLLENINNLINKNKIRLKDIKQRIDKVSKEVRQLPLKQRQLYNYERQFDLYNEIYTFLLKKRSETEIGKAGNIPVHEVIDEARLKPLSPVKPKTSKNYMIAFLLGVLLPGGFIVLKDYFNDKLTDAKTIENISDYPVVGNIVHKKGESENVIYEAPHSAIAEAFRSVRTNFQFLSVGKDVPIALVTSAGQGEGKSFVSINLATSFALYQRKTVLVSFDLRRPNIYSIFHLKGKQGLSCYLSNNCNYEDIISHSNIENLDVIPAGQVPPNPSELIASDRTDELFRKLKEEYDYIVLDTPPVGLVTDAFLLVKYSSTNLFVVRHNYTSKRMFQTLISNLNQKNIRNVNIIVNDIKLKTKGYEYQYGYRYDTNYY